MILAIDIGTTNLKAALIGEDGKTYGIARVPTPAITRNGCPCYSPEQFEAALDGLAGSFDAALNAQVRLIAFTGMAEAGLLVERSTLAPLSPIRPWFDKAALPLYERVRHDKIFSGRQSITGLPDSGKYGIYKLLTLLETGAYKADSIIWIGVVAYMASRLTGNACEDLSIAARTACVDITARAWDDTFLESIGLDRGCFPKIIAQGKIAGTLIHSWHGIPVGTPVCLSGHDHVCAAYGCGMLAGGGLFISTGTAQVLLGTSSHIETESGLSYGPAPYEGKYTVLGSIQSAGGSINLFKRLLYPETGFETLLSEAETSAYPPEMVYFPYLAGSGAPHIDPMARAGITGLSDTVSRGDLINAVYGGIALETRYLAEALGSREGRSIFCMGGLTKHRMYMRALADALNSGIAVPGISEGTLYGAAALALDMNGLMPLPSLAAETLYRPDPVCAGKWDALYTEKYLPQMKALYMEEDTHGI